MIKTRNHGVLDTPLSRGMTTVCGAVYARATVPKREAAAYGSPRFRGDDIEGKEARAPLAHCDPPHAIEQLEFHRLPWRGNAGPDKVRTIIASTREVIHTNAVIASASDAIHIPFTSVIPGWSEGPDPESRDSGFDALHRPGMT